MPFLSRHARVGLVWQFAIAFAVTTLVAGAFVFSAVRDYANDTIQTSSLAQMSHARAAVFSKIDADLELPESIVKHNATLARLGALPLDDEQRLSRFFVEQVSQEPSIDYLFFANEQGGIASGGTQFGEFRLVYTKGMKAGIRTVERVDASGAFLAPRPPPWMEDFDPRKRAWYVSAKAERRLAWAPAAFGTVNVHPTLALAHPLIAPSGEFKGVLGGNVMLDSLSGYLESHRSSPNAHLMLLEPDGTLIANSSRAPLFSEKNGEVRRLKAESVPQPFSREAAGFVRSVHESRSKAFSTLLRDDQGRAYYLDAAPYVHGQDIRWYLVTIVPRSDFAGPLDALWSRFLLILLGGAVGAVGLSLVMAGWVTRPMRAINERVKQIAAGKFGSRVETRRQDEIGQLVQSFNDMSERLAGTYAEIERKNAALDAANRDLAALLEGERLRRMEAEAEGKRAHLLGEATAAISETQAYDRVLRALPNALVHSFVDWAVVEVAAPGGETRAAGAHREPEKDSLLRELTERYPAQMTSVGSGRDELEAGEPLHFPAISDEQVRSWCEDERQTEGLGRLGTRSSIIMPLVARQKRVGVLALVSASPNRFEPADVRLVAELGRRTAMALDSARLYADLQRENAERRQAEAARAKTEDLLRQAQKMEAIGNLAGGIAHDFNNLLSVILGYSHLLLRSMEPTDAGRADVEEIERAGMRATALTQQLLAFGRKQLLQPRVIRLSNVVAGVETMLRRLIDENIELTVRAGRGLGCVSADPTQMEQILMNLVVNARDALPRGGKLMIETANVTLDQARAAQLGTAAGPHVMLTVMDDGIGMDPATQARIFEPFFTTKEVGKGTGLGLATVFGLVQQSGGCICVDSEPGRGTTFSVYLPRVEAAEDGQRESRYSLLVPVGGSETILLVEDEEQVRVLVRTILERFGYHVIVAQTGGDALLVSESHAGTVDLLLTDVIMPHISGRQLAQRLGPVVNKVLYMSGYTEDSIVRQGLVDSSIALIQKPITPDSLARKVREVLDSPPDAFRPPAAAGDKD